MKKIKIIFTLIIISYSLNGCSNYGNRLIVDVERGIWKPFTK